MKVIKRTSFLIALSLLVAGYFSISPARASAQTSTRDSQEVNDLLSESKAEAHMLESDADQLERFSSSGLSFQSHAGKINEIKEHVNKTGKLLDELENARESASSWQQKAIDEIRPLLQEIAEGTTLAIEFINENQNRVQMKVPPYKTYLTENSLVAKELAALITDYVDYGQHKANFERLAEELQVPNR